MIKEKILSILEKTYADAKKEESNELHNAIAEVINEHKPSLENIIFTLDIIRFELMEAKYKEILGVVKLSDKPPLSTKKV